MSQIDYSTPLKYGSDVYFQVEGCTYKGVVTFAPLEDCYICITEMIIGNKSVPIEGRRSIIHNIFNILGYDNPDSCYREVLGSGNFTPGKIWPESSLEGLEKVLSHMQRKLKYMSKKTIAVEEKSKTPTLQFEYFRFRIGDTVMVTGCHHKIVGYYFSYGFNNFNGSYGYVISGVKGGSRGYTFGYDEYGNLLAPRPEEDCLYISERFVTDLPTNKQKVKKDGNEIKLQRTKAVISRGEVPTGYRICSKVHKTAISSQSLSYTEITRGS